MTWTRSKLIQDGLTAVEIKATFQWDNGDTSVGIPEGFGEDTCVEITAGPFVTWITWMAESYFEQRPVDGGKRMVREEIKVDGNNPATWVVDDIECEYRFHGPHPLGAGQGHAHSG